MKRIGQILLDQGWVSPEHLLRALNHQKLVGGRLGTCLLEMEAVEERLLLRALSIQLGVPAADMDDLRGVSDDVISLLPAKVARRCQAVPFRLLGGQLSIALLGIRDLAVQDELSFVSGKRLRIHVANEARIFEALEKYYGEECPQRFSQLLDRINRARYMWDRAPRDAPQKPSRPAEGGSPWELPAPKAPAPQESPSPAGESTVAPEAPVPAVVNVEPGAGAEVTRPSWVPSAELAPPPAPPPPVEPPGLPPVRPVKTAEITPEKPAPPPSVDRVPTAGPAPAAKPLPPPIAAADAPEQEQPREIAETWSLAATVEALATASHRDEVGEMLMRYLGGHFPRAALLALRKDEVTGWMAAGRDLDEGGLRALRIPLAGPSIFSTLRDGKPAFRGPLPPLPAHRQLAATWGGALPADALLVVIPVRGRAVALVYVDREPAALTATDPEDLLRLATSAGTALEVCIRRQKQAEH